jgi:hypothetical protein
MGMRDGHEGWAYWLDSDVEEKEVRGQTGVRKRMGWPTHEQRRTQEGLELLRTRKRIREGKKEK